jgi:heme A synthase
MIHRLGAYLLLLLVSGVALGTQRVEDPRVRAAAAIAPVLVVLQVVLGVFNVLLAVPVWVTAAHLSTAAALFAVLALGALRAIARPLAMAPAGEALS